LFGFRDDAIPHQYNYLVDEGECIGLDGAGIHGPNSVISMLDHALKTFAHGERNISLHADNCGGNVFIFKSLLLYLIKTKYTFIYLLCIKIVYIQRRPCFKLNKPIILLGQNKNRYVLAYLAWRVMTGLNVEIKYYMQIPGHARCLIDAGFGRIKTLYRRSDCETLQDLRKTLHLYLI